TFQRKERVSLRNVVCIWPAPSAVSPAPNLGGTRLVRFAAATGAGGGAAPPQERIMSDNNTLRDALAARISALIANEAYADKRRELGLDPVPGTTIDGKSEESRSWLQEIVLMEPEIPKDTGSFRMVVGSTEYLVTVTTVPSK